MLVFTGHNIRLDDGTMTLPGKPEMNEFPWLISTRRLLDALYPGDRSGMHLVDLGCLEGGYSVEFARMGFDVLGVEIREANFAACQFVKSRTDLPNLHFVKDDVWNLNKYGDFDIVFCCGLFYHLDKPTEFLHLLGQHTRKLLVLQTHFATDEPNDIYKLSKEIDADAAGHLGRWYREFISDEEHSEYREAARWNSWDNSRSFWLKREHLLQAIVESGFPICMEQFDNLGNIVEAMNTGYYKQHSRGTFIGLKPT